MAQKFISERWLLVSKVMSFAAWRLSLLYATAEKGVNPFTA